MCLSKRTKTAVITNAKTKRKSVHLLFYSITFTKLSTILSIPQLLSWPWRKMWATKSFSRLVHLQNCLHNYCRAWIPTNPFNKTVQEVNLETSTRKVLDDYTWGEGNWRLCSSADRFSNVIFPSRARV